MEVLFARVFLHLSTVFPAYHNVHPSALAILTNVPSHAIFFLRSGRGRQEVLETALQQLLPPTSGLTASVQRNGSCRRTKAGSRHRPAVGETRHDQVSLWAWQ